MGSDFFESIPELRENLDSGRPSIGIGRDTHIRRAIVDKNVRIGKGVRLLNEAGRTDYDSPDEAFYIRDGIIIVPKNSVIADGTVI